MRPYMKWLGAATACAALGAVAFFATAYSARAADKGGLDHGMADLEERVAELEATTARKGTRRMTLVISGQVSKALLWHDINGLAGTDKLRVIDNPNSGTRIRFAGEAKAGASTSFGFLFEMGLDETAGTGLGIARDDFTIRHSAVWMETKQVGRLTVGRTSTATDSIVEIDLSNANVASLPMSVEPIWTYSGLPGILGGLLNPVAFDGGRANIVRYDTPLMAGFQASASWGGGQSAGGLGDDMYDLALRYAGEFGGFRFAAGAGYRVDRYNSFSASDQRTLAGSASLMHTLSGLFASVAAGRQTDNPIFGDVQMWQVRGGWERNITKAGATTLFAEYGAHDLRTFDVDSTFWGIGVVQSLDAVSADLFVSYRSYDIGGALDAQTGMAGIRLRF